MAAKRIRVSDDGGSNYFTLPGNQGELTNEGNEINDTIFGQNFESMLTGLINWQIQANALYKGFAGYVADIRKAAASSTAMTTEAMTFVSGKTYQITNTAKRVWDRQTTLVVFDNGVDHTADVVSVDYLFGKVTFDSGYTVTTPVTVTGAFFATAIVAKGRAFNLTQTSEPIDETTFEDAQANGGRNIFSYGLKRVALEISGVYATANAWRAALEARDELIIEINPDGSNLSLCRGFFRLTNQSQSGNVGELEEETINFALSVPDDDLVLTPFRWDHSISTTLNTGLKKMLTAWEDSDTIDVQYLPDGTTGVEGEAIIAEISLAGGLEVMNEFSVTFQGTGALSAVP